MSKIYTYEELQQRFPTVEAVTETRDRVAEAVSECVSSVEIFDILKRPRVVLYGSTVWGLDKKTGNQHTRRSDVDDEIAPSPHDFYGFWDVGTWQYKLEELLEQISTETGVPIEVVQVAHPGPASGSPYGALINPSTRDHFELLEKSFPNVGYGKFLDNITVHAKGRIADMDFYLGLMRDNFEDLWSQIMPSRKINLDDPENLLLLSKMENFPDHLARKLLGYWQMLPCPDSKHDVRRAIPYDRPVMAALKPFFEGVWMFSEAYEGLMDSVRTGLESWEYHEKLGKLTNEFVKAILGAFMELKVYYRGQKSGLEDLIREAVA